MNNTITSYKKNNFEDIAENYETLNNEEDIKSNVEIPPQRDIRETQPTISVNYRVIKNTEESYTNKGQDYSNNTNNIDDWDNDKNEW